MLIQQQLIVQQYLLLPVLQMNGQDVLECTNQNGITETFSTTTGQLTLSGTTTLANYQTVLRSITYQNSSNNPSTYRTITFVVNDGTNNSNTLSNTIIIQEVNDAPILSSTVNSITFTENQTAKVINSLILITDVDSTTIISQCYNIYYYWIYNWTRCINIY
jgi:hypothetical protein